MALTITFDIQFSRSLDSMIIILFLNHRRPELVNNTVVRWTKSGFKFIPDERWKEAVVASAFRTNVMPTKLVCRLQNTAMILEVPPFEAYVC